MASVCSSHRARRHSDDVGYASSAVLHIPLAQWEPCAGHEGVQADNLISLDTKIQSLCNALTCQGSNKQVRQPALSTHKQPQDGNLQF
jgi:hypothetical protein